MAMRSDLARVGAVLLIGVVLLIVGLQFLQARFSDRGHYLVRVRFSDARNIQAGASVLMAGVPVGFVREVALEGTPPKAVLTLAIREGVRIPQGSTFRLSGGLLFPGETRVEILPPAQPMGVLAAGSVVDGEPPFDLSRAFDRFAPEIEATLQEAQRTLAAARTLLEDQQLRAAVQETLQAVEQATQQTTRVLAQTEGLLRENRASIRQLLASAADATREMNRALQSANRLLQDPQLRDDLRATLASARASAERVEQILQEVNQLVADEQLQEDLKATVENVRTVSERAIELADKTGAVLENAETLTRNLNETLNEAKPVLQQASESFRKVNESLENFASARTFGIRDADYRLDIGYNTDAQRYRTDLTATFYLQNQNRLCLGLYDFTESDQLIAQYGVPLSSNLMVRYGLYGAKAGFGVDYRLGEQGLLTLDLFDPNDWRGHARLHWRVSEGVWLWGGIDSPFRRNQPAFGIRIQR
ncbi:MAG: MlaD family protein [Fimbriimonadales bacterium]|nr:MlaD family protein [Fimbriimonadales bacterium]